MSVLQDMSSHDSFKHFFPHPFAFIGMSQQHRSCSTFIQLVCLTSIINFIFDEPVVSFFVVFVPESGNSRAQHNYVAVAPSVIDCCFRRKAQGDFGWSATAILASETRVVGCSSWDSWGIKCHHAVRASATTDCLLRSRLL